MNASSSSPAWTTSFAIQSATTWARDAVVADEGGHLEVALLCYRCSVQCLAALRFVVESGAERDRFASLARQYLDRGELIQATLASVDEPVTLELLQCFEQRRQLWLPELGYYTAAAARVAEARHRTADALALYTMAAECLLSALSAGSDGSNSDGTAVALRDAAEAAIARAESLRAARSPSMPTSPITADQSSPRPTLVVPLAPHSRVLRSPTSSSPSVAGKDVAAVTSFRAPACRSGGRMGPVGARGSTDVDALEVEAVVLAKDRLSSHEVDVLRSTSNINGLVCLPWSPHDVRAASLCASSADAPFTDPDGLLPTSSKQRKRLHGWRRPCQFVDNPCMVHTLSADAVTQTLIGDCSFVASLAVTADYERKWPKRRLVTARIYPQNAHGQPVYNPHGKYLIKLWFNGVPRSVIVDDLLPVDQHNKLLCAFSTHPGELWVSLLEKAYLKVHGGYGFPGSNSGIDLYALSGWIPEGVNLCVGSTAGSVNTDRIFTRLHNAIQYGDVLATIATGEMDTDSAKAMGLVPEHAYAVLEVFQVQGIRLLRLKNPWSHIRWKGDYSPADTTNWTPELARAVGFSRPKALRDDNGIFFIRWEDACRVFHRLWLSWNPQLFAYRHRLHDTWAADAFGPKDDSWNVGHNPQYRVTLTEPSTQRKEFVKGTYVNNSNYLCRWDVDESSPTDYTLVVSQLKRERRMDFTFTVYSDLNFTFVCPSEIPHTLLTLECTERHSIGVSLYRAPVSRKGLSLSDTRADDEVAVSGNYHERFAYIALQNLSPGRYIAVPSTFSPGEVGHFTLTLHSGTVPSPALQRVST